MKTYLEHILNPLHIYCRMVDITRSKSFAQFICHYYDKYCWGWLYGNRDAKKEWKKGVRGSAQRGKSSKAAHH